MGFLIAVVRAWSVVGGGFPQGRDKTIHFHLAVVTERDASHGSGIDEISNQVMTLAVLPNATVIRQRKRVRHSECS